MQGTQMNEMICSTWHILNLHVSVSMVASKISMEQLDEGKLILYNRALFSQVGVVIYF